MSDEVNESLSECLGAELINLQHIECFSPYTTDNKYHRSGLIPET